MNVDLLFHLEAVYARVAFFLTDLFEIDVERFISNAAHEQCVRIHCGD